MSTHTPPPHLPIGTLTLMFTDIEGSTLLWQEHGNDIMAGVIDAHNAILRAAKTAWDGTEVRSEGDAFFFLFPTASAAVICALEIQLALHAYQWDENVGALRVRVGIHTGDMLLLDNEYHGMPANLAKRIADAAHGGQILISTATHELVKAQFPEESFIALGAHRLKNIQHPEPLFQFRAPPAAISKIIHEERWRDIFGKGIHRDTPQDAPTSATVIPELQTEFPPLRTVDNLPNNLPLPMNNFIGRESEIRRIVQYFANGHGRLVTLTGAGGIGKTRLALQAATELLDIYPDGVWFIPLADLVQPVHVLTEIATAFALPLKPAQDTLEQIVAYLSRKTLLIILDNFEHLMEAVPDVRTLLLKCPLLHCLTTSREMLGIAGEQRFIVPPLSIPSGAANWEDLQGSESVQLFLARAEAVAPNFQLTPSNADAIGAICRMLDGLSLAIELAAARVRGMTPQHILKRLKALLNSASGATPATFLSTRNQDVPARHQTLNAVIDWSYELLGPDEQRLLQQLSVFSDGFFLEAAETIWHSTCDLSEKEPASPAVETLDLIFSLHDKSLLVMDEHLARTRYRLSVPLQLYLRGKHCLTPFPAAHARYYLRLAQEQNKKLQGPEQTDALAEMAIELDNFRAAFGFAKEDGEWLLFGQLAVALSQFFYIRGLWNEGLSWLKQAETELHASKPGNGSGTPERLHLLTVADLRVALSMFYNARQESQTARQLCESALQIFRDLTHQPGIIKALSRLGIIARYQERFKEADTHFAEALGIAKRVGDKWHVAFALNNLGFTAYHYRHFEEAKAYYSESLELARELGDKRGIAYAFNNLGKTVGRQGLHAEAKRYHNESLKIRRELADKRGIATSLNHLGLIAYRQNAYVEALRYHTEGLHIQQELGDKQGCSYSLGHLGLISYQQRNDTDAERYYTESLHLARELPHPSSSLPYLLDSLGKIALRQGKYDKAREYYTESLQHRNRTGAPKELADSLYQFGRLARAEGKLAHSLLLFFHVERIYAEAGATTPLYVNAVNAAIAELRGQFDPQRVEELKSQVNTGTLQETVNKYLS